MAFYWFLKCGVLYEIMRAYHFFCAVISHVHQLRYDEYLDIVSTNDTAGFCAIICLLATFMNTIRFIKCSPSCNIYCSFYN